jgi:hypothetical protein
VSICLHPEAPSRPCRGGYGILSALSRPSVDGGAFNLFDILVGYHDRVASLSMGSFRGRNGVPSVVAI